MGISLYKGIDEPRMHYSVVSKVQDSKQARNRNTRGREKKQRQSIAGDPGGYLQQFLPRDPERSADVDMISID